MRSIGEIIGWKFNNAEGMHTVNNVIVNWPKELGPEPTAADLEQWDADMTAIGFSLPPTVDEVLEALIEQVPSPPGSKLEEVKRLREMQPRRGKPNP